MVGAIGSTSCCFRFKSCKKKYTRALTSGTAYRRQEHLNVHLNDPSVAGVDKVHRCWPSAAFLPDHQTGTYSSTHTHVAYRQHKNAHGTKESEEGNMNSTRGKNERTADLGSLDLVLGVVPLDCHRPRGVLEVLREVLLQSLPYALLRGTTKR